MKYNLAKNTGLILSQIHIIIGYTREVLNIVEWLDAGFIGYLKPFDN